MPNAMQLAPARGARILVAGGCGGIGRELVRALLDAGVTVAAFDLPSSVERHPPPAGVPAVTLDEIGRAHV